MGCADSHDTSCTGDIFRQMQEDADLEDMVALGLLPTNFAALAEHEHAQHSEAHQIDPRARAQQVQRPPIEPPPATDCSTVEARHDCLRGMQPASAGGRVQHSTLEARNNCLRGTVDRDAPARVAGSTAAEGSPCAAAAESDAEAGTWTQADGGECTSGTMQLGSSCSTLNCYRQADASLFSVRSKQYMDDKRKVPAGESMLDLVGCDTFTTEHKEESVSAWQDSVLQRVQRNAVKAGQRAPRMLVIRFVLPGHGERYITHAMYFAEKDWTPESNQDRMYERMLEHFMTGESTKFRAGRLKMLPVVVAGPWVVKQAVGKPALICKKVDTSCVVGEGYLELTLDVSTSTVARKVLQMITSFAKELVIDLAFVIEGRSEKELPERVLGSVRVQYVDMDNILSKPSDEPDGHI